MMEAGSETDAQEALRHAAVLQRLTQIGMKLAQRLNVVADDPDADGGDLALEFNRIARAVRQTVALESWCPDRAREKQAAADHAIELARPNWEKSGLTQAQFELSQRVAERQFETEMIVDSAIARDPRIRRHDDFRANFEEFLGQSSAEELFASDASLAEVIACICKDLGLSPDWQAFESADWGALDLVTRRDLKARQAPQGPPPEGRHELAVAPQRWGPS